MIRKKFDNCMVEHTNNFCLEVCQWIKKMETNGKMRCFITLVIVLAEYCHGQETNAERDGRAVVSVALSEVDFGVEEQHWRDTLAWHASMHCKKGKTNCWSDDKQIRYHDVVIMDVTGVDNDQAVEVSFHIRDRYDNTKAGLSSQQVRSFFLDYEEQVETAFGGGQMSLVSPGEEGMEGWLIAVITISCVLAVALIITIAVLASKHSKLKKEQKIQEELNKHRLEANLLPGYVILNDGKINPVYDSDHDKPTTSGQSSDRNSASSREPPPAYIPTYFNPEISASEVKQDQKDKEYVVTAGHEVPSHVDGTVNVRSDSTTKEEGKAEDIVYVGLRL